VRSRITARRWLLGLISFFLLFLCPSEKAPEKTTEFQLRLSWLFA
jgi:hypothetical protein